MAVVQVVPLSFEYWYEPATNPLPPASLAAAFTVTLEVVFPPSVAVTVGTVLSILDIVSDACAI